MIPAETEWKIHYLLNRGWAINKVAARLKISRGTVWRARKRGKPQSRLPDPVKTRKVPRGTDMRCTRCKSKLTEFPCLLCHSSAGDYFDINQLFLDSQEGIADHLVPWLGKAVQLIYDLNSLEEMDQIKHPLFLSLASQARGIVRQIPPKRRL